MTSSPTLYLRADAVGAVQCYFVFVFILFIVCFFFMEVGATKIRCKAIPYNGLFVF